MLSLINDIIDFSVMDKKIEFRINNQNFNLHNLLKFCFRMIKILINCRGLKDSITGILEIDENVSEIFYSDELRLKQVILNLVSNSIKFTRRGYIKLSAKLNEMKDVEISIEDTGIGIEENDLLKLFKNFCKLNTEEANKLNKNGSGLGLSICKKIISKIGSKIGVESKINIKTRFYFIIVDSNKNNIIGKLKKSLKLNLHDSIYLNKSHRIEMKQDILFTNNLNDTKADEIIRYSSNDFDNNENLNYYPSYKSQSCVNNFLFDEKNLKTNNNPNSCRISQSSIKNKPIPKKQSFNLKNRLFFKNEINQIEDTILNSPRNIYFNFDDNMINLSLRSEQKTENKLNLFYIDKINNFSLNNIKENQLNNNKEIFGYIRKYLKNKIKNIILIVDDNEIIRNSIKNLIKIIFKSRKIIDYKVITLTDGIEILNIVMIDHNMECKIKLIICDEKMIYMNGVTTNKILLDMYKERKINLMPFVYCSSNCEDKDTLMKNGINYNLHKPPSKNDVINLFDELKIL